MNSYLYLKVEGINIDKFLLKCNKNNINILKIRNKSYKSIVILINENNYNKILKIGRLYKITIINSVGLKKYKNIIRKYNVFFVSLFIGIILLILLSNIIFDIDVIGDNNTLNKMIIKELSNNGIEKYKFKKSYKELEKVKNIIRNKYKNNIEWIEIKEVGTKYIINFVERKVDKKEQNKEIYSIVSTKSGIVKDIYTYKGVSVVDIDNYVSKGDILISSDIMLNDEVKYKESADGKVYGEVWYRVNVEYPFYYKEKNYTNKKRKIPYIKVGNKYLELFKYKNYDRKKIIYYKNDMLPFEIGLENIRYINIKRKKYSIKEALSMAEKEAENKILQKLNDDEHVMSQKTLKFYGNGSKIIVDIFFSVYEEIGEKRIIEMGEVDDTKNVN
ncbi:MAG: sporulation protein YqfD [Bacilli bacterium]|nr:sporulation protein YqfD [Bacilli bacterium]